MRQMYPVIKNWKLSGCRIKLEVMYTIQTIILLRKIGVKQEKGIEVFIAVAPPITRSCDRNN